LHAVVVVVLETTDAREPEEEDIDEETCDDEDEKPDDAEAMTEAGVKDENGTPDEVLGDEFVNGWLELDGNVDDVLECLVLLEDGEELSALDEIAADGNSDGGGPLLEELPLLLVEECVEDEKEEMEV
jgi:hypothetical protein